MSSLIYKHPRVRLIRIYKCNLRYALCLVKKSARLTKNEIIFAFYYLILSLVKLYLLVRLILVARSNACFVSGKVIIYAIYRIARNIICFSYAKMVDCCLYLFVFELIRLSTSRNKQILSFIERVSPYSFRNPPTKGRGFEA